MLLICLQTWTAWMGLHTDLPTEGPVDWLQNCVRMTDVSAIKTSTLSTHMDPFRSAFFKVSEVASMQNQR